MKKGNFFKRLMCVMLIMAVLAGYALPGYATGSNGKSGISFQRVDNSMVSASLTPSGKTEITPKEFEYESTDIVRVSIVLSKPSTIEAGFAVEGIAQNDAAMSYRDALKNEQIGICVDVNHFLQETAEDGVRALGDRILTTHISDHDYLDEKHWMPGAGVVPWKLVYDRLTEAGYTGPWLFELGRNPDSTQYDPVAVIDSWAKESGL
jgi:hypothetical protein